MSIWTCILRFILKDAIIKDVYVLLSSIPLNSEWHIQYNLFYWDLWLDNFIPIGILT